jgi:hypothetical protein
MILKLGRRPETQPLLSITLPAYTEDGKGGTTVEHRSAVGAIGFVILCVVAGDMGRVVAADLFVLRNGGRLRGTWLNRQEAPSPLYAIRTEEGIVLKLAAAEVRWALPQGPQIAQYEQLLERCPDTVDGHWQLAEWCRAQELKGPREAHLQRILELDPDHFAARRALGFSQLRGEWVTPDEIQRRRGYQRYAGRWRLPQEIELLESSQTAEHAQKRWLVQLLRWREMLNSSAAREAYQGFEDLRDPQAVRALTILLQRERYRQVKLLYLDALERIGTPPAIDALIAGTLQDPDDEIFHACLEKLVRLQPPRLEKRYVAALKDEHNVRVNRAAFALARLQDTSVLSPLIAALVTTHYLVIPKVSDHYTATFVGTAGGAPFGDAPLGGTGFSAGSETQVIPQTFRNQEVLTALIRLSGGMNFGFDQRAWQHWLDNENNRTAPAVDARRSGR